MSVQRPSQPTIPDTPLRRLRAILGPMLGHHGMLPLRKTTVLLGITESTWRKGEVDVRQLSKGALVKVLAAFQALGIPLRPDHLYGYAPMPETPRELATRDEIVSNIARLLGGVHSSRVEGWPTPQHNEAPEHLSPPLRPLPTPPTFGALNAIQGDQGHANQSQDFSHDDE